MNFVVFSNWVEEIYTLYHSLKEIFWCVEYPDKQNNNYNNNNDDDDDDDDDGHDIIIIIETSSKYT